MCSYIPCPRVILQDAQCVPGSPPEPSDLLCQGFSGSSTVRGGGGSLFNSSWGLPSTLTLRASALPRFGEICGGFFLLLCLGLPDPSAPAPPTSSAGDRGLCSPSPCSADHACFFHLPADSPPCSIIPSAPTSTQRALRSSACSFRAPARLGPTPPPLRGRVCPPAPRVPVPLF